jgi:carbon-monoxide dehydrogenase large subunit
VRDGAPPEAASASGLYVGRSLPRVEDRRLLTGHGSYADDLNRDGQLHASIVRSDIAHGTIRGIDVDAAKRRPGVVAVFTAEQVPDVRVPVRLFPTPNSTHALQPALARDRVRYVGDPVAVVVAEDPYTAEDAAGDVFVEIDPLEPALDPVEALEGGGIRLHDGLSSNLIDTRTAKKGRSVDAAFARAAVVVSERLHVQRHGAVPLEARGLLAEYEAQSGRLTTWGAAKVKFFNRGILAKLLGLPLESVRYVEGDVGGAFGARGEFYPEDFLIPWLAIELGRPVKWIEDRRENLIALNQSREQVWEMTMAADADGRLLAFRGRGVFNQGAYARTHGSVLLPMLMINHLPGPYRWSAYEIEASSVATNKTPAGTYRGPGQYEPNFIRERMVDLVARELELDPVEIRRRNLVTTSDMPYKTGLKDIDSQKPVAYDEADYPATFERLLEHVDYDRLRREVDERRAAGETIGLGVATFIEMGNPGVFEQSRVIAEPDGSFTVQVGIASVGQGVETVLSQIAADQLGVAMERVLISYHDTDVVPEGQGAFSSRATVWGGHAIAGAIQNLVERAREAGAERLGVPLDDVVYAAGAVAGPGQAEIPVVELGVRGEYRYEPGAASHILMGANVGVVGIDAESGRVEILRYAISYDIGKAINPLTLVGQVRGAAAQGIGGALFEEFAYDEGGQPLATSLMDYAMPTAAEIPDVEVILIELDEATPENPLAGAKGGGEGGIIATAATIANAIADALGPAGDTLTRLPITPERVQRAAARSADQAATPAPT